MGAGAQSLWISSVSGSLTSLQIAEEEPRAAKILVVTPPARLLCQKRAKKTATAFLPRLPRRT